MKTIFNKFQGSYQTFFRSSGIKKNIAKVYSGDVLSRLVSAVTAIVIIRGLSIDDYAAYTAFYAILLLVPGLIGSGVNMSLVSFSAEYISKEGKQPLELYFISFVFQLALYSILGIFIYLFSDKFNGILFGDKSYISALEFGLIGGAGFLISQAGRGVYSAEEKFGLYVRTLWARQFLVSGTILILYFMNRLNFQMVAYSIIAIELGVAAIISVHIFRDFDLYKIKTFIEDRLDIVKEFILSTRWLLAYFFTLTCFQRLDIFMLSHFSTENELAIYGVALKYYSLSLLALGSIHAVLLPKFAKLDMQDVNRQRDFTYKWLKKTVWLIVPVMIFALAGKALFVWINGVPYEKAFYVFVILSIGVWLSLMFSPLVNILIARKHFKFLFIAAVGTLIFNFTGNYFLIPLYGSIGAALIVILSQNFILQGLIILKIIKEE